MCPCLFLSKERRIIMRVILAHGRNEPDQDINNWGYNGPDLEGVKHVHGVYGDLTVDFRSRREAQKVHELTGWPYFDEVVLEISFFEELVLCEEIDGTIQYFGD